MENVINTSGVTVVQRSENPFQGFGSAPHVTPHVGVSPPAVAPATVAPPRMTVTDGNKKRGRPRKYGPDGSVTRALSPRPISSLAPPPVIDFSVGPASQQYQPSMQMESLGEWFSSGSANFTPHILNVNAGEDVVNKVISFSQQRPTTVCIISGKGVISSVTFHHPDAPGGTRTYEGRFEILTLSGLYMPSENGGIRNRSGRMSISLAAGPDGYIIGGSVAGVLVAAGPVEIIIGSFLTTYCQNESMAKKARTEATTINTFTAAMATSNAREMEDHNVRQSQTTQAQNISATPFAGTSCPHDSEKKMCDINVTLPE